jgi:hypothetical protein
MPHRPPRRFSGALAGARIGLALRWLLNLVRRRQAPQPPPFPGDPMAWFPVGPTRRPPLRSAAAAVPEPDESELLEKV